MYVNIRTCKVKYVGLLTYLRTFNIRTYFTFCTNNLTNTYTVYDLEFLIPNLCRTRQVFLSKLLEKAMLNLVASCIRCTCNEDIHSYSTYIQQK